ncbi:MAG: ATP-binding protein [Janthinobacterium lividum]
MILIGVVFALILPGVVFAGVLITRINWLERSRSEDAASSAALRAADALDRELANLSAALLALSTSPSISSPALDTDDIAAFDAQARTIATTIGQTLVLSDPEGNQLVNTRLPRGANLPRMAALDAVRAAVETRGPVASNLFIGNTSRIYSVVVVRPVLKAGKVVYVLAINLQPLYISNLLISQGLPPGWIAHVTDGEGRIIARTAEPETFIGQSAAADLIAGPKMERELRISRNPAGQPMLMAMQQVRLADWRVAIGVSMHTIEAPLRATTRWLLVTGAFAVLIAALMAWQLARSVAGPLHRLARAGSALAAGLPVLGVRSRVAEVDSVSRALVQATQDLRDRAAALSAERAQLAAVIETVPVGLVIAEANGQVVAGNSRLDSILRHGLKRSGSDSDYGEWIAHHADGSRVKAADYPMSRVLHGAGAAELQCLYQRGDRTEFWVHIVAAPILKADGSIAGGVAAVLDIDEVMRARQAEARFSEQLELQVAERTAVAEAANQRLRDEMAARAKAEEQLHQAQKMEAVGQLTGGIAHDFNNLLTIVIGSLDLLRRRAQDDRTRRLLDNALEGSTRAATLTARLLAFSRRQPLLPQAVDLNKLVTGMSDLLHRTLGEAVQLETVLAGGVWQTHADPNQLENALLNLAVNGRDAIAAAAAQEPGGSQGRLVIATSNAVLDADFAPHDNEFRPGDYVRVSVTDTGTGMPPEIAARVFEPFYTTKPLGQGTGLGLSQVHGFVKQSGGHVSLDTRLGEGTTVAIHLPRLLVEAKPPEPEPEIEAEPEQAALTVLVVEDDAGVRRYSVEALRDLGHTVLEAGVGLEALRLLDAHPEIDVLLTDVVLPMMDGPALALEARRRRPGLPVLFASGYTGNEAMNEGLLPAGAPLLQKPYTVHALSAKLRSVLAEQD